MHHRISRRHALCCGAAALGGLFTSLIDARTPDEARVPGQNWPSRVADLVAQVFEGLDPAQLCDVHTHLLGTGDSGSGCWVNPQLDSWRHPMEVMRKRVILQGAGVDARSRRIDDDYVQRLLDLTQDFPAGARWLLLAFEHAHDDGGRVAPQSTTFHVPDAWALQQARRHAAAFSWIASVHPYRDDAPQRLRQAIAQGAVAVKWLPSAMNIDLRDPRCRPVYDLLAGTRTPLLIHGGEEKAVPGAGRDDLGNPLLARVPLAHGVRVIVAHCASLGTARDLDARRPGDVSAFSLFARLMSEPEWNDRLCGDVSAVWQVNRSPEVWRTVIERDSWHPRLMHGSDYPLPCVPLLLRTPPLVRAGVLSTADAADLERVRELNPLLFDFALKRRLRWRGHRLSDELFAAGRHFRTAGDTPPAAGGRHA